MTQSPKPIVDMYQGYYIDFYSGRDEFIPVPGLFYSKEVAVERLKEFFDTQKKNSAADYDFAGYIVKVRGHLAVTTNGIEQGLLDDDNF